MSEEDETHEYGTVTLYSDETTVTDTFTRIYKGGLSGLTLRGTFTAAGKWHLLPDESSSDIIDRFARDLAERFPA